MFTLYIWWDSYPGVTPNARQQSFSPENHEAFGLWEIKSIREITVLTRAVTRGLLVSQLHLLGVRS
jgi:hypothetical protein